ncbi:MAG: TetR/AcrR family transcriptional regulator [Gammaproteobacteria bacterium]|nr:TetR/AcrR family transcriptional regulator [Gammaproteobacteria bacterium]
MDEIIKTTDKRRLRGEESRRLILQAAVDSIAMEGLGSLTLDRVAKRVGISRGLVVFHFKSKKKLVEEVLQYLSLQYSGGWFEIVENKDEEDASKLLRLIDYDIRFACEHPKYVSAWHAFWGDAKGNQLFHEMVVPRDEGYAADMTRLLENISDTGGYDKQDLPTITRGLVAMMFGVWVQLHLNPGVDDCSVNTDAVRLFLRKMFPDTAFPASSTE